MQTINKQTLNEILILIDKWKVKYVRKKNRIDCWNSFFIIWKEHI